MNTQASPVTSSAFSTSAASAAPTTVLPLALGQEEKAAYADESARIKRRRELLGIPARPGPEGHWGLALSGGGIRSATFSLGVLQGLALTGTQPCKPDAAPEADEKSGDAAERCLLEQFDYLSTVSGGGYIGGFFASLFVPGRWRALKNAGQPTQSEAIAAAADAYEALRFDPPGRFHSKENYLSGSTGAGPLAWLRENGRYMMPSGAGDMLYAMALGVRNWLALQYVLGSVLLMLFSLLTLIRVLLIKRCAPLLECSKLRDRILNWEACAFPQAGIDPTTYLWASPAWLLVLAAIYFLVLPVGIMFWLVQPRFGANSGAAPSPWSAAALLALAFAGVLFWFLNGVRADQQLPNWYDVSVVLMGCAVPVLLGGLASLLLSWCSQRSTVSVIRVQLTRWQSATFKITSIIALLALLDTLAQQLYWWLCYELQHSAAAPALLPGLLAAFVWLVRAGSKLLDEKEKPDWLRFIPMSAFAAVGGVVMLLLVAMVWGVAVQWVRWQGALPTVDAKSVCAIQLLFAFSVAQALALARFPGFINLSSLQSIYSSRLTRAYLGASNRERFESTKNIGVSEPIASDALTVGKYYDQAVLAPLHLINVTVNQTVDPAEQLVQRDRKGKPLVVGSAERFAIDGQFYPFVKTPVRGEIRQPLTVGQWIGVSGAAFTTGLGRTTSLGFSLLLGLANVRLGTWWESGIEPEQRSNLLGALFRTQICLQQELLARFYGLRRKWQYLSDGGHFENTGVYELLRTQRNNKLIVVCDNGCDPDYHFDDLANLIRLARIDQRLELATDTAIAKHAILGKAFGTQQELADKTAANDKCALLLNVFEAGAGRHMHDKPICCIVVLKPRLIASATLDVHQYWQANTAFPQETTFDQSFDEAQWESYRRLGISTARRVFGCRGEEGIDMAGALWSYLFDAETKELRGVSARK